MFHNIIRTVVRIVGMGGVAYEDDPTFPSFVARPTHFELLYYVGRHYDCFVDRETGLICSTAPALPSLSSSTIIDLTCQ